ncbi:hypothetical protein BSKO_03520 [Bryopsis sp. KO-2023]|nr:hypothetical protein BSKO_03520 [Bryopsis sp. KO-2023]
MPLVYSFVARGTTVLAEHAAYTGNFKTVGLECLQKARSSERRFTVTTDGHTFNFANEAGLIFLVVADDAHGREVPIGCLDRIVSDFQTNFSGKGISGDSMQRAFGGRLKHHIQHCEAHPEEISRVSAVRSKVEEVKNIMVENIDKVLERGQKIEVLADKAHDLNLNAQQFHKAGVSLRRKMWFENFKMKVLIVGILLILALVIFLIVCFSGGNCLK